MQAQKLVSTRRRLEKISHITGAVPERQEKAIKRNVSLDCGWGNLIMGQTFTDHDSIVKLLTREAEGRRDIAFYIKEHHVLLARAPEMLFLDPSDTYRLWLYNYRAPKRRSREFYVRILQDYEDAEAMNGIYRQCGMLEAPVETIMQNQRTRVFCYYVAQRCCDGRIVGAITGIDHKEAFNDPENGASFWCLAVDPEARTAGIGRALVREVAEHFIARGREYLDLSVLHDNTGAKKLYRSLGFRKAPIFAVKKKNRLNRKFYLGGPKP